MNNKRNILFAFSVLLSASLACQSLSPSETTEIPQEVAITEESSPILPEASATEEAPAQTSGVYDGSWAGTNMVDDKEILFDVENNQVTSVSLNYTGDANGCTYHGAASVFVDPTTITGDGFTVVYTNINDELTFTGTFTSESEASGILHIKSSPDGLCGEFEKEITWTASKGFSTEAEATEDTSGLVSADDSVAIVTNFFNTVNAGDVDTALEMVDDNVMFSFGTQNTQFGRDNLKAYLSSGVTYQISDTESFSGGMTQFKATASDGTVYSFCTVLLQDGKIISLSLQP